MAVDIEGCSVAKKIILSLEVIEKLVVDEIHNLRSVRVKITDYQRIGQGLEHGHVSAHFTDPAPTCAVDVGLFETKWTWFVTCDGLPVSRIEVRRGVDEE